MPIISLFPQDSVPSSRKINNKALTGDITLGASDVGALASGGTAAASTKLADFNIGNADLNTLKGATYWNRIGYSSGGNSCANKPANVNAFGLLIFRAAAGWTFQMLFRQDNNYVYARRGDDANGWQAWYQIYPTTNISGNAGTATKLKTARTFPAVNLAGTGTASFDGSADPTAVGVSGTLPVSHGGTGATTASAALTALGGVPTTRKVNGKALSADVTLGAGDIKFTDGQTFQQKLDAGTLKGDKGDKGNAGTNGTNGVSPTVAVSKSGTTTTIDITDVNGKQTATIKDGSNGAKGDTGARGSQWYSGTALTVTGSATQNLTTGTYLVGDYYLNTSTGQVYRCTVASGTNSTWTSQGNIKGAVGAQGPAGAKGDTGPQGAAGAAGPNTVSTSTGTNITGLLKGNGSKVAQAVANTDYLTPGGADAKYLPLKGGTLSGTLNGTVFVAGGKPQTTTVSNLGVDIANTTTSGGVEIRPNYIKFASPVKGTVEGLNDPTKDDQAATKKYVDDKNTLLNNRMFKTSYYPLTFNRNNASSDYQATLTILNNYLSKQGFITIGVSCNYQVGTGSTTNAYYGTCTVPVAFVEKTGVQVPIDFNMTYTNGTAYNRIPVTATFYVANASSGLAIKVVPQRVVISEAPNSSNVLVANVLKNVATITSVTGSCLVGYF